MDNTIRNQIDLVFQASRRLPVAFLEYRTARWNWDSFVETEDKQRDLDHEQREARREKKAELFDLVTLTMGEARRLHDEYMTLESTLNQMRGMQCHT